MSARHVTPWILLATLPFSCAQDVPPDTLRAHVRYLASDELAGREAGAPGIIRAEEYVAAAFARYGLQPLAGEDDFFVDFTLYRQGFDPEKTTLEVAGKRGRPRAGKPGADFRPFAFSDAGEVEAEVVFAGYGITAPEHRWNDYAGLDVEGKLVLVLRHEPEERDAASSFDGARHTQHAFFAAKAENARERGARGMILVTDPLHHDAGEDLRFADQLRLEPPKNGGSASGPPFLAVHVSQDLAQSLLPAGAPLAKIQHAVDDGKRPADLALAAARARIRVTALSQAEAVPVRNVAGFLAGGDPRLRDEWIVVGGHHDHIGAFAGRGDTVFNGADDNASGTAGVLELARAFAERAAAGRRPRRSLVFMTFTAEEKGLLGSRAVVGQERIPVDKTVFMLNLDMIGRNPDGPLRASGDGHARGLRALVEEANDGLGLALDFAGKGHSSASDHDTFFRAGVPYLFLSTGVHGDYHQLGDHADRLAYDRMRSIVTLSDRLLDRLADLPRTPSFIHQIDWLGLEVEVTDHDGARAAQVTAVEEGSRAADSGFLASDRVVAFDGRPLDDPRQAGRRFRDVEPGRRAVVTVARAGERLELAVERARPGFMGVVPARLDEGERRRLGLSRGEGLVIAEVVPDGPAARAGLESGDVVVRINGRGVNHGNLVRRLSWIGAGETVGVVILRNGERQTLSLTLGERPDQR